MPSESGTETRIAACPEPLQEIIEDFRLADPRERLEYLIEFADDLPDLPARLLAKREEMDQVHECMTPVFLFTEVENGAVHFFLDIPREAPTVRGYAGVLVEGLNGASPDAVLAMPEDIYMLMGLHEAITPQRLRGLHALVGYMKRQVRNLTG